MCKETRYLLLIVFTLLAIGIVILFSATAVYAAEGNIGDPYFFLRKQIIWVILSIIGLIATINVSYKTLEKIRYLLLAITILLLVVVLIPGLGTTIRGTRRWFRFDSLGIQPSEVAKIVLVVFFSAFIARNQDKIKTFFRGFLLPFGLLAFVCGLIVLEPDVGTAIFIALVVAIMLIVGGVRLTYLAPTFLIAIGGILVILSHKLPHILDRINTFLNLDADPLGKGYNIYQSLIALGSGGIWGVGLGGGTQKLFFLPEMQSDFIFSIIGEELGFLGTSIVIGLFLGFLYIGYRISKNAPDLFASILAFGITLLITLQAIINICVVTASIPAKGIPLTFISFGGSSLFFTMLGVGILVNIANSGTKELANSETS